MVGSIFLFWTLTVCLSTTASTSKEGQPRVVGSLQPVVTHIGDDVILPCRLQPSLNVERLTVEWSRPDLKPDPSDWLTLIVHLHRGGHENTDMKLRSYIGRTELSKDGLKSGDISLKILNVTLEDGGRYRCFIPKLKGPVKESVVTLVVVFSEPSSVQTTIETQLDARQIKNPDPKIPTGRSHLGALIVVVVCVLLVLGGGVGGYLLKHKKPQKLLGV
uniref:Ig-like domain-containing protein n=1 Tax=Dicentrarchus labrax TaxID=13489 RepID=A0A8P4KQD8_DICLA